jgi:hypothetical protein
VSPPSLLLQLVMVPSEFPSALSASWGFLLPEPLRAHSPEITCWRNVQTLVRLAPSVTVESFYTEELPGLGSHMTNEEIDAVAEELAKVGGLSWYPGRTQEPLLRAVSNRYKDRARVAIAALERLRARNDTVSTPREPALEAPSADKASNPPQNDLQVGAVVVYRPPGDRRAIPCRIEHLEERRAYLIPCPKPDIGWVELGNLQALPSRTPAKAG